MFTPVTVGALRLKNRIVMAPMTRSRVEQDATPGALEATYYAQRASAGLIITEGTAPSATGLGYSRTPGIYTPEQIEGWRAVVDAVHAKGGTIVLQIMHVGRVAHPLNQPEGAEIVAPSAIAAKAKVYTEQAGMQEMVAPRAIETDEIPAIIAEFAQATRNAREAGFDGVELHATSGYLPHQFLSTNSNQRTDAYGGSPENRARFVLEVIDAMAEAWSADRVGIKVSPGQGFNDMVDETARETYGYLADELAKRHLAYLHVTRQAQFSPADQTFDSFAEMRRRFKGPLIVNGGLTKAEAETLLANGQGDLFSFGAAYIANPDLLERLEADLPLAVSDRSTHYAGGSKGYIDYPTHEEARLAGAVPRD
ncbi:alkene reductase [bacterium]|nr:alkene reductase [bacterium]